MALTLRSDDRVSHYRIVGPLGAGGMGEVYVAADESLDRNVALKILPPLLVRSEERVQRFIREAKSASSLNHPNIVTIYEIGEDAVRAASGDTLPVHFISMELVNGDTLTTKIHEKNEDARTLVGYVAQAAEGVAKAHAAGIVHRDLKPSNIVVSDDGFAKVLDFGLAKLTERESGEAGVTNAPTQDQGTREGVVLGSVAYMSPEQVQAKATDHRSDIFSMGCILYEVVTRRRPFVADTDVEVMHQILRDRPRPVEEVNPSVPAELTRIIRRCLAKSPDQRFQSMKDLAMDLREVVDEWDALPAAGSSIISGATPPVVRKGPKTRAIVIGAALAGVALVALLAYAWRRGPGAPPTARAGAGSADIKISTLLSRSDLGAAVLSGDGRYLAYVVSDGERSTLLVRQVRTGSDVQIVPPQELPVTGIAFSRDGDYLYFLNRDPKLINYQAIFQVPSLGGTPTKIAFDVDTGVTFSPDGTKLCFRRGLLDKRADALIILDLPTGKERELIRIEDPETFRGPDLSAVLAPAWSPDGRRIAATIFNASGGARTWVTMIDAESGRREDVVSYTWLLINGLGWMPAGDGLVISGMDFGRRTSQVYRMSYPSGEVARITSDLDGYTGASVSSDGKLIAALRTVGVGNAWIAPTEPGKEAHPVTNATGAGNAVELVAPLDGGAIAFSAADGETTALFRAEADGSGRKRLAANGTYVINLTFAPGAGIVYTMLGNDRILHVWRVEPDGSGLRQITEGNGENHIDVAPDGSTFTFVRVEQQQKVWIGDPASGRVLRSLEGGSTNPGYSGDGRRLLNARLEMTGDHLYPKIYVVPPAGGEPLASFPLPSGAGPPLVLDRDGSRITYVSREHGYNLMRRSLDRDDTEQLTHFAEGRILAHRWSPDGRRIVLHRRVGQQDSLWLLESGSKKPPTELTGFRTGRIENFEWGRDSRSVLFMYGTVSQDVALISDFR